MKNLYIEVVFPRLIATILVVLGISLKHDGLYHLLASGILLGMYYGWFNDVIWRPNGELSDSLPYRAHQIWIHIICGVVGSSALYLLLELFDFSNRVIILDQIGWTEFLLFIISILGYTGLLPRILWYFTYAQQSLK